MKIISLNKNQNLTRFGIETTFVNPRDVDAFRAAIRPETRLIFGETLGNPGLDVLDIPRVAALAHEAGLPLLVDSTFTRFSCEAADAMTSEVEAAGKLEVDMEFPALIINCGTAAAMVTAP